MPSWWSRPGRRSERTELQQFLQAAAFGPAVRAIIEEVTDDKQLVKAERKARQAAGAPRLSDRAKAIRIADKIANVRDVTHHPPAHWDLARRRAYLEWTAAVVVGCRGVNPALEACYDQALAEGRAAVEPLFQ